MPCACQRLLFVVSRGGYHSTLQRYFFLSISNAITPASTLATKAAPISSKTTAICATVAPNITNMRFSIFLSMKTNDIIATITKQATTIEPHKEIYFTIMI